MSQPSFYVYAYFRPWNGQPCYIGKGCGRRWLKHFEKGGKHPNRHFAAVFAKAARLGMAVPKLKIRERLTEAEAIETEIALIKAIGRKINGGPLCNSTDGGEGLTGYAYSDAHRAKISVASKASHARPENKAKHAEAIKSALTNPETKCRQIEGLKRALGSPEARERTSQNSRAAMADQEIRDRISSSLKGRKKSAKTILAMRKAAADPAIKLRRSKALKKAILYLTNPAPNPRFGVWQAYSTNPTSTMKRRLSLP